MQYRDYLNQARNNTSSNFFAANEDYARLVDLICETTFSQALQIENTVSLTKYQHALLASFVRSTVVSVELIIKSELVEAVTILRKQVELLARLYELENKEFSKLSGKTPNLSALKTKIKRLYSLFSEGAHSATYGSMSLLGFYKNGKRHTHLFYPEFTENTEIILENWVFVFLEFTIWTLDFKTTHYENYNKEKDEQEFHTIYNLHKSSGLYEKFRK